MKATFVKGAAVGAVIAVVTQGTMEIALKS
jgi:hypothetical protein